TTVGGVSAAARRAALDAREALFAKVAPALGAEPGQLVARAGRIGVRDNASRSLSWKEAAGKLGVTPLSVMGVNAQNSRDLNSAGAAGVQVADVSVDVETGIVKMNRFVAVQDCGLVLDLKLAESQVYGAVIMGVAYSLFEEKVSDPHTGKMLNANMEFYRLAGAGDIGQIVVKMMTGPGYDERGVIGLGEPPVIAPGAAISNAVANAIGVRVPDIPLTPDRVLAALEAKGGKA
ncbi:MAG: molybdopterin cofactor-binding domain-containing protein, partial [Acidobacteriota bacterium]